MLKYLYNVKRTVKKDGFIALGAKILRYISGVYPVSEFLDLVVTGRVSPEGWYRINPFNECSFELYSSGKGRFQRARIRGKLEPQVTYELKKRVQEGMHVWDVGAAWGYYTQIMACLGATVTAFEVNPSRCKKISEANDRNGWRSRVTVVQGAVGEDISLDEYPTPDVVKMDIEGYEYVAIKNATTTLSKNPVWIVEVHEPSAVADKIPSRSGDVVKMIFRNSGYKVNSLRERSMENYHIVAEK